MLIRHGQEQRLISCVLKELTWDFSTRAVQVTNSTRKLGAYKRPLIFSVSSQLLLTQNKQWIASVCTDTQPNLANSQHTHCVLAWFSLFTLRI